MVTTKFISQGLQAYLALTLNCNCRSCLFIHWAFKSLSLRASLMMETGSHNQFSHQSFGGPNIDLFRIELSLHSKHWEHRPLWVSVVHGWAGVAGHLVESLSRIRLLGFSLSSCSSFDRAWRCRRYLGFGIRGPTILLRQYPVKWGW